MIQIEVNGVSQAIEPDSIGELKRHLEAATPPGHVMAVLKVDGVEMAEHRLDEFAVGSIGAIEAHTAAPGDLAREALVETRDWIGRICGVLESIAEDFRLGRDREGTDRLVAVMDALHVLVGLLQGIHDSLVLGEEERKKIDEPWHAAELELKSSVEGLVGDLEAGDPVRLADRAGHSLPRSLGLFRDVLGQIPA